MLLIWLYFIRRFSRKKDTKRTKMNMATTDLKKFHPIFSEPDKAILELTMPRRTKGMKRDCTTSKRFFAIIFSLKKAARH